MSNDQMRYDILAREALRGVLRQALQRAIDDGIPGSHKFFISFRTRDAGVDIGDDLVERFPDEMTIVLEHQFWDLAVDDDGFEVTLKFNRIPKYLRVPWSAVTVFHDPSVNFALRYERFEGEEDFTPPNPTAPSPPKDEAAGEVVSLDAFRKKDT